MKYDCSKILDYQHEHNRMCSSSCEDCSDCPLAMAHFDCCDINFINKEAVDIVQKWSDTHSEKTKLDAFKDLLKGTQFEDLNIFVTQNRIMIYNDTANWMEELSED